MISVKEFLRRVEEIATEAPSYREGGTGTDGTCDCIGLIVGAIRRAGGSWTGLKGSNYTARNEVSGLWEIGSEKDLAIGEVVLKSHKPGEAGYDSDTLNGRYRNSPDRLDYYHIGVVESVSPLRIRHMSTGGPKIDTKIGKWTHHGWLKKIAKDGSEEPTVEYEKVIIKGGVDTAPIHMRSGPGTGHKILTDIPQGSEADFVGKADEKWSRIIYRGRQGYVMSVFVQHADGNGQPDNGAIAGTVIVDRAELERVYDLIGSMLGLRG
jgi:hypothetical protein